MKTIRKLNLSTEQLLTCDEQNAIVAGFKHDIKTSEEFCSCKYGEYHKFYVHHYYSRDKQEQEQFDKAASTYRTSNNATQKADALDEMFELTPPQNYTDDYKIYHGWTELIDKNGKHLMWIKGAGDYSVVPDGLASDRY